MANPFTTIITFTTKVKQKGQADIVIPAKIDLTLLLADLNMPQAYVILNKATVSYKTIQLTLQGKAENFQNPHVNITGTLTGVNNEIFADFLPDLPNFSLPTIDLVFAAKADLEKSTAQLTQAAVKLKDSSISVSGPINWGGETTTYTLSGNTLVNLEQAVEMTDAVDIRPTGTVSGPFKLTDKNNYQDISGTFHLKDVSLVYDPFTLTQANGTVQMKSLEDISASNLTGLLNGENLTLSFAYKQLQNISSYVLDADLAKLKLDHFSSDTSAEQTPSQESQNSTTEETTPTQEPEAVFNLKTNLKIGEVTIPYMHSNGFTLQSDLTGLSSSMRQANGKVSFSLQPGSITDVDKVIKENKIVRLILLPFGIINSVANKLNISLFDATSSARKGEISFSSGEGEYVFNNGLMTVNQTSFVSDLTNLKGSGTIDFPNDKLDMKVSATLLTKQTPIVIKIGGTLDNPSGKLDVLNTVGSVVGGLLNYKTATGLATGSVKTAGSVAGGAVKTTTQAAEATLKTTSQAAKATVKAIGSLFKKKEDSAEDTEVAAQDDSTAAETPQTSAEETQVAAEDTQATAEETAPASTQEQTTTPAETEAPSSEPDSSQTAQAES